MPSTASSLLPGVYPVITKIKPKIGGINNLGVGVDSQGAEYVLKRGPHVCVAEFVGAALCAALDLSHCRPAIVCMTGLDGRTHHLFGSIIEPQLHKFDRTSILEWRPIVAELCDATMLTVTLAVDLCIGNDDRHTENWIVKAKDPAAGVTCHKLLAMDFSNAWPVRHPPHHPRAHPSPNTWSITQHWPEIGITFDERLFRKTCARIGLLDRAWLHAVLDPLVNIWLTVHERDNLCQWWKDEWRKQVIDVIYSLEPDGEWP